MIKKILIDDAGSILQPLPSNQIKARAVGLESYERSLRVDSKTHLFKKIHRFLAHIDSIVSKQTNWGVM